jgi:hypothetical protein
VDQEGQALQVKMGQANDTIKFNIRNLEAGLMELSGARLAQNQSKISFARVIYHRYWQN